MSDAAITQSLVDALSPSELALLKQTLADMVRIRVVASQIARIKSREGGAKSTPRDLKAAT